MKKFMVGLGYSSWTNPVGLRHDEGHRILKQAARNASGKERFTADWPLGRARITKSDVMRFWLGPTGRFPSADLPQGFDLGLYDYEGNCDFCFLKGRGKRARLIRENPGMAEWWCEQEASAKTKSPGGARFDADESVAELIAATKAQPLLIDDDLLDDPVECTAWACDDGPGGHIARAALQREYERTAA